MSKLGLATGLMIGLATQSMLSGIILAVILCVMLEEEKPKTKES